MKLATAGDIEIGAAVKSLIDAGLPDKVEGITRPEEGKTVVEGGAEFTENGMTMGNTVVEDGKITVGTAADNQTIIEGGVITAKSLTLGSLDGREVGAVVNALEQKTDGIQRVDANLDGIDDTTIIEEGALKISDNGYITNEGGTFAIRSDGLFEMTELNVNNSQFVVNNTGVHMNLGKDSETGRAFDYKGSYGINLGMVIDDIDTRLDVLEDKTQNIKPGAGTGTGTGTGEGGTAAGEINNILPVVPDTEGGHTGINGNVTVGGEINAGEIVVGDKTGGKQTTITDDSITTDKGDFGSEVTVGDKTTITSGNITVGAAGDQTTINGGTINTGDINAATGDFSESVTVGVEGNQTTINGGNVAVDKEVTVGYNTTITDGKINLGGDNGTNINAGGMTVGTGENATSITNDTVKAQNGDFDNLTAGSGTFGTGNNKTVINNDGVTVGGENGSSITGEGITVGDKNGVSIKNDEVRVGGGEDGKGGSYMNDTDVVTGEGVSLNQTAERVGHLENRVGKLEDRIDKVGAMAAAIANLRTMGYDPAAPTEVAVGIGQYRDETGAALGLFHYPNRDFMLSLSVSTSGDEVMGGIGATWKFGRKSPEKVAEIKKAQAEADARRAEEAKLAKAEEMKQAAKEAKIKAQQERHAKMAAEMKK